MLLHIQILQFFLSMFCAIVTTFFTFMVATMNLNLKNTDCKGLLVVNWAQILKSSV